MTTVMRQSTLKGVVRIHNSVKEHSDGHSKARRGSGAQGGCSIRTGAILHKAKRGSEFLRRARKGQAMAKCKARGESDAVSRASGEHRPDAHCKTGGGVKLLVEQGDGVKSSVDQEGRAIIR